ncbi:sensor histidine kinase [Kitasatospora sp. NPDC085895]|uniref:sensor histidine kinase n=1 Tax=Kitasatospora sp. NPDC085895 TaxID=3155057 RepID=UPI00344C3618
MNPRALTPVLRVVNHCLHLLVAGLLALAAARAVHGSGPDAPRAVLAALAAGAVYAAGPLTPAVGRRRAATALWLAALGAAWLALLAVSRDGVWLAFPLYFVQLHLLPRRAGLAAVLATALAAAGGFALHQGTLEAAVFIGPVLGAAVATATVLGYQALYRESEQRRRLIDELRAARADLAAADHAAGVLAERERLAREIHDTLAQGLSSIQLLLRAAERALPADPAAAERHVRVAREAAQDNLAEARRFVRELAPPVLDGLPLAAALERLCTTSADRYGLPVHFTLSGSPAPLPGPFEPALVRVAQSALANAAQHAGARQVEVTLSYMGAEVALDVVDDGSGFDPAAVADRSHGNGGSHGNDGGGFGLAAMRHRVQALGGSLTVESAPGQGTAVAAQLPLPAPAAHRGATAPAEPADRGVPAAREAQQERV